MPTRSRSVRDAAGRAPTATEVTRRRELIEATIAVIARSGWGSCTLQSVADEIGITKAAVVYHVGTKARLVEQAYSFVIEKFVAFVHERIEEAGDPVDAVIAFAHAHVDYLRDHRAHARLIAEALDDAHPSEIEDRPSSPSRNDAAIALIDAARAAGRGASTSRESADAVTVLLQGMIDAAVAAWLREPGTDLDATKRLMTRFINAAL